MLPVLILLITVFLLPHNTLAQSADVLVVNKVRSNANLPGSVAFLDYNTGKIIKTVPVGNEPHEICVSDDQRFALVTNTGSYKEPNNSLSLIDVAKQEEIHRVDLGALWNPHGVIFHDSLFYFTAEGARAIGAYDPETNQIVWINGTGQDQTHMLAMTQDGRYLITTNRGSNSVSIFERRGDNPLMAGAWKHTILPVGENPEGLDMSPDGKQVWIGLRRGAQIAVVDIAEKKLLNTFDVETKSVARVKFSLDGKHLIAADPQGKIVIVDPNTHQTVETFVVGNGAEGIFLHPDGKHVLVGVTNENTVAEIDLSRMEITRKLSGFKGPDAMVWIGK